MLTLKSFASLVSDQAAAIQARATALVDLTIGSVLRSFIEAVAAEALALESSIVYTMSLTRAATSQGTDLDSWWNDYGLTRLGASFSAGTVTFSRFSTVAAGLVPIGTTVRTLDGTQTFTVRLDATNTAYSSSQNGYILAIGISQVTVPVIANIPGPGANAAAGTIGLISSSTPGIDTVNNVAALTGGATAETDAAGRLRFIAYLASLSKGTEAAITFAITSLQLGAACSIIENEDPAGNLVYGFFIVTVDDGTGAPSASLITNAAAAVEITRAVGCARYGVLAPIIVNVSISLAIAVAQGYDNNATAGTVGNAIAAYVDSLALGAPLPYTRISQLAYDASAGVTKAESVLLNNGTVDIIVTKRNVIKLLTIAVSLTT